MGIDVFTLSKSKKYTDMVALGLASATIDDVNKSITFTLASDGSQHTIHFDQPSNGQDGISVTGVNDLGNGKFTLLFSDGSESDPIQCLKGEDGVSPTATVEKVGKVATITITDKNGTTTATIKDGEGSEGGEVNTIDSISVNGVNVVPDENKNVDITVPDAYDDTDIRTELANKSDTDHTHTTVNGHTVESDVPVDAKFTDTVYDDTQVKTQIQAVANGLMDSVGYSADYKTIDIIAKNGVKKSVNVEPIISHASITELSDVDTTNKATGKALVYNATTSKHEYADVSGTDEKVKMDASTDAKYLGELLDNITIANENGELKVKKLDGQEVTITEINYLKGLTMNVMDLVNMFSNGGVKIINTPVATYAELLTLDKSSFIEGISYLVYVLADENHDNAKTTYLVDKDSETPTYFGFADSQRDFTTNPIDLATEITGKLGISNMDSDAIKALFTVDDTYKTETTTNNAFSTHGAKALYDELLLAIGNKANDSDLTVHTDDADIHVSTEDRTNWNSAKTHADSAHAPSNAQANIIESVKVNNEEITPDENKAVNIDLSGYAEHDEIVGRNLIPYPYDVVSQEIINGITFTTNSDGSVTANGTATDWAYYALQTRSVGFGFSLGNGTYTLSGCPTGGGTNTYRIQLSTVNNTGSYMDIGNGTTFTLTEELEYGIGVGISKGITVNNLTFYPMLEKGSIAHEYEPTTESNVNLANNTAKINSNLDGLKVGENCGGKNIFDDSSWNGDKTLENGQIIFDKFKSNTQYSIQCYLKQGVSGNYAGISIIYTDGTRDERVLYNSDTSFVYKSYTTKKEKTVSNIVAYGGNYLVIKKGTLQIEEGTKATPYEPYIPSVKMLADENAQQSNEAMDLKMLGWTVPRECPVQNYTDANGVFHQRVGRVDLGSLEWEPYETTTSGKYRMGSSGISTLVKRPSSNATKFNGYSSKYSVITSDNAYACISGIGVASTTGNVYVYDENYTARDDTSTFKSAMSGVYLYYELAEEKTISVDGNEAVAKVNDSLSAIGKCKNLLNPTLKTTTLNGVTCTNNGDGTYTLDGTATKDTYFVFEYALKVEDDEAYKIVSFKNVTNKFFAYANAKKADGTIAYSVLQEYSKPIGSISSVYKSLDIGVGVLTGATLSNEIVKPMFTTNINAAYDDFVPYTGEGETLSADVGELKSDLGGIDISSGVTALATFKIDSIDLKLRGNHVSGNIVVSLQSGGVFRDSYVLQIPKEYAPKFKTPITANGYLDSSTKYLPGYGIVGTDGKVLFYSNNETNINIAYISFSYDI